MVLILFFIISANFHILYAKIDCRKKSKSFAAQVFVTFNHFSFYQKLLSFVSSWLVFKFCNLSPETMFVI